MNCPLCTLDDILEHPASFECLTCGHDWEKEEAEENEAGPVARVVKDAHGNVLENGDIVAMVKDLKVEGNFKGAEKRDEIQRDSSGGRGP